jgi:hypothetical protein
MFLKLKDQAFAASRILEPRTLHGQSSDAPAGLPYPDCKYVNLARGLSDRGGSLRQNCSPDVLNAGVSATPFRGLSPAQTLERKQ